jgi:general secretion pathway protein G
MTRRNSGGFTLVELLLVLIILSVLAAIVVPKVVGRGHEARVNAAKGQIGMFESALEMYAHDNYQAPTSEQGLKALVEKPTSPPVPKKWKPDYLSKGVPQDPWGNEYKYLCPGKHFPRPRPAGRDGRRHRELEPAGGLACCRASNRRSISDFRFQIPGWSPTRVARPAPPLHLESAA